MKKPPLLLYVVYACVLVCLLSTSAGAGEYEWFWINVPAQVYPGETLEASVSATAVDSITFSLQRIEDPVQYITESRKERFFDVSTWRPSREPEKREIWQNLKNAFFQSLRTIASRVLPEGTKSFLQDLLGISGPLTPRLIEIDPADFERGTEFVKSWREKLHYAPGTTYTYTTFQVAPLERGVYLLTASTEKRESRVLFSVSSVGMVSKQDDESFVLFVQEQHTGVPLEGARIRVFMEDELIREGETAENGIWKSEAVERGEAAIMVEWEDEYSFLSAYSYYFDESLDAFIYTERPIYRPGQRVFFRGVLRTRMFDGYVTPDPGETVKAQLVDFDGNVYEELTLETNRFGTVSSWFDLPALVEEGSYFLELTWRERVFTGFIEVQEYEKPVFEIELEPEREVYAAGEELTFQLAATYYTGEPMSPGSYRYRVIRYPAFSSSFGRDREVLVEEEGDLDAGGKSTITFQTPVDSEDIFWYEISCQVFDPAFRVVETRARVRVLMGDFALVLRPDRHFVQREKPLNWEIRALDAWENLVEVETVRAQVEKLTWNASRWEWDSSMVWMETIPLTTGEGELVTLQNEAGYYRLEVAAVDSQGRLIRASRTFYVTGRGLYIPTERVEVYPDKETYSVGEEARLVIVPPVVDTSFPFLLSVEGSRIHHLEVMETEGPFEVTIPILPQHRLGCYVSVASFFSGDLYQEAVELIIDHGRELSIDMNIEKDVYRPGEEGTITLYVTGADGLPRQAEVSVGIVDQAIFDMAPFWREGIVDHYYRYMYNRVFTLSSLYTGFYGYGERVFEGSLQMKEALGDGGLTVREFFPDTLLWFPDLVTDEEGRIEIPFTAPDNLTRWRVEARAVAHDEFGEEVNHFRTASPFALRLAVPPFLRDGDTARLQATLWNELAPQRVELGAEADDGLSVSLPETVLQVGREETIPFPVEIHAHDVGDSSMTLTARGERASDGLRLPLPRRERGVSVESSRTVIAQDGEARFQFSYEDGDFFSLPDMSLELFQGIEAVLNREISYMFSYPFRCSEQVASRILSLLTENWNGHEEWIPEIPREVHDDIHLLYSQQSYDGGWGWWRRGESNIFNTAHVLLALQRAREKGYPLSEQAITRGLDYLEYSLEYMYEEVDLFSRAMGALALKQVGRYWGHNGKLFPQFDELDDKTLSLLIFVSDEEERLELVSLLRERAQMVGDGVVFGRIDHERPWINDRFLSTSLAVIALREVDEELASQALLWLLRSLPGEWGLSTLERAWFLQAAASFVEEEPSSRLSYRVLLNGEVIAEGRRSLYEDSLKIDLPGDKLQYGTNTIEVSGEGYWLASFHLRGVSSDPPSEQELEIKRRYSLLRPQVQEDGNIRFAGEPFTTLKPGDEVLCELEIESPADLSNLVIEDGMGAGFELVRDWYRYPLVNDVYDPYQYVVTRLHRGQPVLFVENLWKGKNVIRYIIRARDAGEFYVPPTRAYLMYFPEVTGYSEEDVVEIRR